MSTAIEQLETLLNVDVDNMSPSVAQALPFKPHNMTSNQYIVNSEMQLPESRDIVIKACKEYGHQGWSAVFTEVSVQLCKRNIGNLQGRVLLQTSTFDAYSTEKTVDLARAYAAAFERIGVSKFVLQSFNSGPALNACAILLKEGIRTLGTALFSLPQAIAASQAGCLLISPYYNEIAAHGDRSLWTDTDDPALKHPTSPRVLQILQAYRRLYKDTGKMQPLVMPASFITPAEALACGEMGFHHVTLPAPVLAALSATVAPEGGLKGVPKSSNPYENPPPIPERLASIALTDPLAPAGWDGTLASTSVDYLADSGKALDEAIEADPQTKRRLYDALEFFKLSEKSAQDFIEKILQET